MAKPNKTVAKAAARRPHDAAQQAERDAARDARSNGFAAWCAQQYAKGRTFESIEAAQAAFNAKAD
jgi:hypothetical protein